MLRPPRRSDEAAFVALRRASARFLRRWEPRPPAGERHAGRQAFERYLAGARTAKTKRLLLCRSDDGTLLGSLAINEIIRGALNGAFLGYWIGQTHAGRGYMTEGLRLGLEHAFLDLSLHRVEANVQPANAPSRALVARAGFRLEGFSPGYLKIAGHWADHERWALTIEDWREGRRRGRARAARTRDADS